MKVAMMNEGGEGGGRGRGGGGCPTRQPEKRHQPAKDGVKLDEATQFRKAAITTTARRIGHEADGSKDEVRGKRRRRRHTGQAEARRAWRRARGGRRIRTESRANGGIRARVVGEERGVNGRPTRQSRGPKRSWVCSTSTPMHMALALGRPPGTAGRHGHDWSGDRSGISIFRLDVGEKIPDRQALRGAATGNEQRPVVRRRVAEERSKGRTEKTNEGIRGWALLDSNPAVRMDGG